jgi:hypothetical protein
MAQQVLCLVNSTSSDLAADPVYGNTSDPHQQLDGMKNVLTGVLAGAINAQAGLIQAGTAAFATGTMTGSSVIATNAVSVCGVVFTCVSNSTLPSAVQFQVGASDNATMLNLAAAINANTTTAPLVLATVALKVLTLQSVVPGLVGNQLPFSQTSGATITCTGSGYLTSGAGSLVSTVAGTKATEVVIPLPGIAVGAYVTFTPPARYYGGVSVPAIPVIFTAVSNLQNTGYPASQSQQPSFLIGRNDAATMANLALAINQCQFTNELVRATASGLIVTLTIANSDYADAQMPTLTSGQASIVASTSSGTFTAAPVIIAGNTIVLNGTTLTATVGTQNTTNFIVGTTDNATLLNIATTIAANGTLSPLMVGSVSGNTLTITSVSTNPYTNTYTCTVTGGTMNVAGPTFTGAQLATQSVLHFGY